MRFGDLQLNDKIYDDNGELTNVVGIYPQGTKDIYEIEFSDGLTVRSCDEHLWEVSRYNKNVVLELSEIRKNYLTKRGDSIYYVKVAEPVNLPTKDLPLDPYVKGSILSNDLNGVIPNNFLYGDINQRVSLLQGFMDSKGVVTKNGIIKYTTKNENIINSFRQLCHSLGIITQLKSKNKNHTIELKIKNDYKYSIFRNNNLQNLIKNKKYNIGQKRGIVNIKYVGKMDAQCIEVDNNSHLYLTDHFIPTHNTVSAAIVLLHFCLFNDDKIVS